MKKYIIIVWFLLVAIVGKPQGAVDLTVCYGEPIYLFCNYTAGCTNEGATFTWSNEYGWASQEKDPCIMPGDVAYRSSKIYLSIQFPSPPNSFFGSRITVTVYSQIIANSVITKNYCSTYHNGAIDVTVSGGLAPYTYLWSNGATTQDISSLASGTYTLTITDNRACTKTSSFVVGYDNQVVASTSHNTYCRGNNGAIHITANENCFVPPFAYQWSNGATTQFINGLAPGTYTVTITDSTPSTTVLSTIIE